MSDFVINIPGVYRIVRLHKSKLGRSTAAMASCGMKPIIPLGTQEVGSHGIPSMTSTKKTVDNGTICEAKLTFRSSEDLPQFGFCYIVLTNAGKCYLLGDDKKCPVINRSEDSGNPDGSTAVYTYDIVMEDVLAPIEVVL